MSVAVLGAALFAIPNIRCDVFRDAERNEVDLFRQRKAGW